MSQIISSGAEAIIELDGTIVHKKRIPKTYRLEELDNKLRLSRTNREKKVMKKEHLIYRS